MKTICKMLSLLLALCMVFSLMACTQPDEPDNNSDDHSTSDTSDKNNDGDKNDDSDKNDPTEDPKPEPKNTYYLVSREVFDSVDRPGDDPWICTTEFDENGNPVRYANDDRVYTLIYGEDGLLQQAIAANADGWMKTVDYTWDENGNLAEVVYKYESGDERYRYQYEYTADGRVSKETFYDFGELDSWTTYTYTDTGYHFERYNPDGTLDIWNDTVLDEHGYEVERRSYQAEDGSCFYFYIAEHTFSESGDRITQTVEDSYGEYHAEWVLDEHGNVIEGISYDENGDQDSYYIYEYAAVEMTEAQYRTYQQVVETFGHY